MGIFVLIASSIFWAIIKAVMGIRVTAEEEIEGLDVGEHGISAYPDFHRSAAYGSLTAPTSASQTSPLGVPAVGRSV